MKLPNKTIYDIGANVGLNIPYYLLKATKVVAVEANPALVSLIKTRFKNEILSGQLVIENCAVVESGCPQNNIPFYIHKTHSVWSTAIKPNWRGHEFETIMVPVKTISEIVLEYGPPFYIKIDIEGFDLPVLRDLFRSNIFPPYISVEAHNVDVFCALRNSVNYNAFKLVEGKSVNALYHKHKLYSFRDSAFLFYSFPPDSAGPFGDDLNGEWMTANNFLRKLAFSGLGWKDIHATNVVTASPEYCDSPVSSLGDLVSTLDIVTYLLILPLRTAKRVPLVFWRFFLKLAARTIKLLRP